MIIRKIFLVLAFAFMAEAYAQTPREKLDDMRAEVKTYGEATNLIMRQNKYAEGIALISKLITEVENTGNCPPERLSSYYKLRAHGFLKSGKNDEALPDANRAVELLEKAGAAGRNDLSAAWYMLALVQYYRNAPAEAMKAADKCVETAESYFGHSHSETLLAYELRANYAALYKNAPQALHDMRVCFDIIRQNVERNIPYLTVDERSAYWSPLQKRIAVMPTFAHGLCDFESDFTDALYDQQLLTKGLLLTAESALQRAIDSDASLKTEYDRIARLRKAVSDEKVEPAEAEKATLEADRRERDLAVRAVELSRFRDFIKTRMGDVKAKLRPGDVAVEFVDYRKGRDSVMYAALVLQPGKEHVRFIPLIEEKELESEDEEMAARLWNPILAAAGKDVCRIFFAPTGGLHLLPVESWALPDGTYFSNRYEVYRLSSTRMLALAPDATEGRGGVAYGGLVYNTLKEKDVSEANPQSSDVPMGGKRVQAKRLAMLPGTLAEARELVRLAGEAGDRSMPIKLYDGVSGTETSFKELSGQHKRLIHLGTHAFYNPREKDELKRSGICFSGADNYRRGGETEHLVDDGVLTSYEAAQLDLSGLDLLVLSACQSGLGKVTPDGVFGLQRGFKKAGAGSLLMTLWPVADHSTMLLMNKFYAYLFSGDTKRQALEKAKCDLRAMPAYSDPRYWAAFVLLDALD